MAAITLNSRPLSDSDTAFVSVFASKTHTTPTPEVTPNIGALASPGTPFGGFNFSSSPENAATNVPRAWNIITRFLAQPPDSPLAPHEIRQLSEVFQALNLLLDNNSTRRELLDWYLHEISAHFRLFVLPQLEFLQHPIPTAKASERLAEVVNQLENAQQRYLGVFDLVGQRNSGWSSTLSEFQAQLKEKIHIFFLHALPRAAVQKMLAFALFEQLTSNLNVNTNPGKCLKQHTCSCDVSIPSDSLKQLFDVGLGGALGERALAVAVQKFIEGPAIERRCFAVDWANRRSVMNRVRMWSRRKLVPTVDRIVAALTGSESAAFSDSQLTEAAVNSFGRSRIRSLFDYVRVWPDSLGAILDIREYLGVNGTTEKAQLCEDFGLRLDRRIIHAGASTAEILTFYINFIGVFKTLDSRGVLLERVARWFRMELSDRDDTVNIVAASFLCDIERDPVAHAFDPEKVCVDLAMEVAKSKINSEANKAHDFDDMEWVPEPIDAGANYKITKSDDIVAYMLGLFDQENFVRAFHTALGQHLLRGGSLELAKETKLVELLKSRLDSTKIQSFEVMLRDMRYSQALNRRFGSHHNLAVPSPKEIAAAMPDDGISIGALWSMFEHRMDRKQFTAALTLVAKRHHGMYYAKRTRLPSEANSGVDGLSESLGRMKLDVTLTSAQYWPSRRNIEPIMPQQLETVTPAFENEFAASTGGQRKLKWDHGAGTMTLELQFEDRRVMRPGVASHRAVILDAFATERQSAEDTAAVAFDPSVGLNIAELSTALNLPEDLVVDAVNFWVEERVLYQISSGQWAVLERLDMAVEPAQETLVVSNSKVDPVLQDNELLYQTYIVNILKSMGGPRAVGGDMGLTAMLKMMIADFTYGDDEVEWLLSGLWKKGEIKSEGGGVYFVP